ncbi:hypothetical protein [Streptantibioticus parmotrematis]|uniref:hypothetical protein n=1 Tax=Streptantibioticus parmotrematis TaxID=2873249 RepID=UPI0027DF5398|nr:hypothetical protein [Streptantibioticus parmotrematis]
MGDVRVVRSPGAVRLERPGGAVRRALPAVACVLAVRLLGVATLALFGAFGGQAPQRLLAGRWDSLWYARVAAYGYGYRLRLGDGRVLSDLSFFPLLPWLERALSHVTGALGPAVAGVLVSAVACAFAAAGVSRVADGVLGGRAAFLTAVLWAAVPVGVVESMAYSEALFVALAAWALAHATERRWLVAAVLACLAGLTRPAGLAVAAAVVVGALWTGRGTGRVAARTAAAILAPAGAVGYVVWVAFTTGRPLGYLDVQRGWGNGIDGGLSFARFTVRLLTTGSVAAGLAIAAGVAVLLWCHWLGWRDRYPVELQVYTGVMLLLALTTAGYFGSKPRLLLPAFGLLLPLAGALARVRPVTRTAVMCCLVVGSALYGAFWLNGSGPP